jgi:hypothetical protein
MSKKVIFNILLICLLLLAFPLLWLFNQRLNYRKFLTLNTKFSLRASSEKPMDLSSVNFIFEYFQDNGMNGKLHVDVESPQNFEVLGRKIIFKEGTVEVYEYASQEDASEKFGELIKTLGTDNSSENSIYRFKNLLIYNKDGISEVDVLLERLINEKNH